MSLERLKEDVSVLRMLSNYEESLNCLAALFSAFQQSFHEHKNYVANKMNALESKCNLLCSEVDLMKQRQNPVIYNGRG